MWMETASSILDLVSEVSSLADSDIRDLDFDSVNAHTQLVEVSVQGPVRTLPAMDILFSVPQCATLLMCAGATSTLSVPFIVQSRKGSSAFAHSGARFPARSSSTYHDAWASFPANP